MSLSNHRIDACLTGLLGFARPLGRRHLATVQDTPVRRYGGLKDQDRIFTNAYSRHDHGIKGAMVRFFFLIPQLLWPYMLVSLVVTGIGQKTFSLKATHGSSRPSRTLVYVGVAVLVSQVG